MEAHILIFMYYVVYISGTSNDAPSSRCKSVFNLFFVPLWIVSCFWVNRVKKTIFLIQISWILKLWFEDQLTSLLTNFINEFTFCIKRTCVRLPIENLFCPNNASETYIFISWWHHQKLLLAANQLQDSTFFYLRLTARTLVSVN